MRIVFWENIVSSHKISYWKSLSSHDEIEFLLVVEELITEDVLEQGWELNTEGFPLIESPDIHLIREILEYRISDSFHVFSGIRAIKLVFDAFKLSLNIDGVKRILLTEKVDLYGIRKYTRRIASLFIERPWLAKYDLILGSGVGTKNWYIECGVPENRFFDFLYTTEAPIRKERKLEHSLHRFIIVSRLIPRKRVDLVIMALKELENFNWTLDIFGTGPLEVELKSLVSSLNLTEQIFFKGVRSNTELLKIMPSYNTLVLASRHEGWGVVINEALHSGLRVVCSDVCGGSILLNSDVLGSTFKQGDVIDLTSNLKNDILSSRESLREFRLKYLKNLTGEAVAKYLVDIINYNWYCKGSRPLPPWER